MIVYASRTGNCEHIQKQLNLPSVKIENGLLIDSPFFLLTYTDGIGKIPLEVKNFMDNNYQNCKGVISSGNSNFGVNNFCGSADNFFTEGKTYEVINEIKEFNGKCLAVEVIDDEGDCHAVTDEVGWLSNHFRIIEEEY